MQDTLAHEHTAKQGMLACEHISMQDRLACEHISMQGTLAHWHMSMLAREYVRHAIWQTVMNERAKSISHESDIKVLYPHFVFKKKNRSK